MTDAPRDIRTWTHGCDACNADAPVEYVPPLGYLCAFCRRPESLQDLWREHRQAWSHEAAKRDNNSAHGAEEG